MTDKKEICISEYVRAARDIKGIKYKWIAEELGTTQSNLSHKLAKDSLYAIEFLKIAMALDMDLNKMIEEMKQDKEEGEK